MKKLLFFLVCVLAFVAGMVVGYNHHQKTLNTVILNHDEMFYHRMVDMETSSELMFSEFPLPLKRLLHASAGDKILVDGDDTLSLVCVYPNQDDLENRYLFYVMKDNHDHLWSLFQYEDGFHLYREDETIHADWLNFQKENKPVE